MPGSNTSSVEIRFSSRMKDDWTISVPDDNVSFSLVSFNLVPGVRVYAKPSSYTVV